MAFHSGDLSNAVVAATIGHGLRFFRRSASGVVMLGGAAGLSLARQHGQNHIALAMPASSGFGTGRLDRGQPMMSTRPAP